MRIFFHIAAMKDGWYNIYREIYDEVVKAGLLSEASKLVVGFIGSQSDYSIIQKELTGDKYELNYFGNDFNQFEFPTLDLLQKYCNANDDIVLYIHSKGASDPDHLCKLYWRKAMVKSMVTNWRECVQDLNTSDLVGYGLHMPTKRGDLPPFYVGNFWWAKSSYISKCVPIMNLKKMPRFVFHWAKDQTRFQCEFWLRTGPWLQAKWKAGIGGAGNNYNVDPIVAPESLGTDPFDFAGIKVDKRYLLSIKELAERRESALREIKKAEIRDVEVFDAIVPAKLEGCSLRTLGQLGCYLSNRECIKRSYESGANAMLMIEDDVEFVPYFQLLLKDAIRALPADWDVAFIGAYEKNHGPYKQINERVWETADHWGTQCYMLSKSGLKKMYDYLTTMPIAHEIDMLMVHQMPHLRKYSFHPSLAFQKPFRSSTRLEKPIA